MTANHSFEKCIRFISKIPGINPTISSGIYENSNWWIKLTIDIHHSLAWHVIQELGHILNYISLEERLPTIFYPVSPAPYMNGGPEDFLSWIIESTSSEFTPEKCLEWLEGRMPSPIDDLSSWNNEDVD